MTVLKATVLEIKKLKRLKMNIVGLLCAILSVVISCFQMLVMSNAERLFSVLEEAVIWNNVTLLMPFTIALMGGYYINRESVEDTQKNILMIPVEWSMIIKAKIVLLFLFGTLLGITEWILCTAAGVLCRCKGINPEMLLYSFVCMVVVHICIVIAVLPVVLITSGRKGTYIWGALLSTMLGIYVVFISNGELVNFYPLAAGLVMIHFRQIPEEVLNWKTASVSLILLCFVSYVIYRVLYKKRVECY
ncbi:MAG: ABC transporter permease [Lachnospiraceae bacterium]|nr:ABC transporter permease [Lachnospiraceae bacterium]